MEFIPLSVPCLKGNEQKYVAEAISSEWVSTAGAFVNRLEQEVANYLGVEGAIACQSGTAGLHLALIALDIHADHEVIVPTLTFIAAVNPVSYVGAKPVFMDCDRSFCLDPLKLERFCAEECSFLDGKLINKKTGKNIRAIIVVHVFGNMADMEKICDIAAKYNLYVVEDATEAIGSCFLDGKYCGSFAGTMGDIGVYSFNGNKIITTGGGGITVAKDRGVLKKMKYFSTQAKDDPEHFIHNEIGYNYRMTNIQAAMGVAQLEQLENFIATKKENYDTYLENGIKLLPFREDTRPNYWFYSAIPHSGKVRIKRQEIINSLKEKGIQARPVWGLIHEQKPYTDCQAYLIEQAKIYENEIINLPCSSNLKKEEIVYIAKVFLEICQ